MKMEEQLSIILDYYYETETLKDMERTGWSVWNISRDKRVESIPEHIYGTQQLAIAIYSEFELDIDIQKVIAMLAFHEIEEIRIGDLNPFSGVSAEEKAKSGKVAVQKTVANLKKKNLIIDLIDEFNERKTPEAEFAYFCDKMEADLMAKKYEDEGRFCIDNVSEKIMEDERVKRVFENGAKNVGDVFIEYDVPKYKEIIVFCEMIQFLKKYIIKN